jgi:ATPase family associated with various cellular activities (AAA)
MLQDLTQLMTQHRIILVRCNPLDREWIVSTNLSDCVRWRLNDEIGSDPVFSPFSLLLDAIRNVSNGGNFIFDNYLTFVATLAPWERQLIYEQFADLYSLCQYRYRLVLLQTDDTPLPIELARFIHEYNWTLPTAAEITELFGEYHFEPTDRNLRLASGLAYQDLKLALQQSGESPEPELYLETYRNARLSLMGVKYDPPPVFKEIAGLDELVAAIDKLKFRFSQQAIDLGLPYPKGWLLVGIPGTGKTYSARSIASALGYPMLSLEIDKIKVGGLTAMARVLEIARVCAPCIFYMDESEKLFTRDDKPLLSLLLTWLQDKTFPVFVIGTLNRIEDLPVEATRAGRFDAVWEVDSPDAESRLNLFLLFLKRFDSRFKDDLVFDKYEWQGILDETIEYVGAEIEQIVIDTIARVKECDPNGEVTARDLLEEAMEFHCMFERNSKQIVTIRNSIRELAKPSHSKKQSILAPRNFDPYRPAKVTLSN